MYSELIAEADETLAENVRVRREVADTGARTRAVLLEYRRHRFVHIGGGSDADNGDRVRSLLRAFWTADEMPKSYVAIAAGPFARRAAPRLSMENSNTTWSRPP